LPSEIQTWRSKVEAEITKVLPAKIVKAKGKIPLLERVTLAFKYTPNENEQTLIGKRRGWNQIYLMAQRCRPITSVKALMTHDSMQAPADPGNRTIQGMRKWIGLGDQITFDKERHDYLEKIMKRAELDVAETSAKALKDLGERWVASDASEQCHGFHVVVRRALGCLS